MDKSINTRAEVVYSLAKRAGLTDESQADFVQKLDLETVEKELEREKEEFINFNKDLDSAESVWAQGQDTHIDDKLIWNLVNYSVENNKGIVVDWKFAVEDVVANVEMVTNELNIKALGEKQVDGKWIELMVVDGEEYSFGGEPGEMILETIGAINKHLSKLGKLFIYYDLGTDDMYFLMVNKDVADEFGAYKFILPE